MALRDLFRWDTWENVLSGVGVSGVDRRRNARIDVDPVTEEEARQMWQTDFLAKAAIELVPETAFRDGGFNIGIKGEAGKKIAEEMHAQVEDLSIVPQFIQALKFNRAYGGAGIFPALEDGGNRDFSQRLDPSKIIRCNAVHVFEPRELQVATWYDDIMEKSYRRPKTYHLQPVGSRGAALNQGIEIHESRLVMFRGIHIVNDDSVGERPGYGDNVLTVAKQTLADFGVSFGSIIAMLDQFSQGILSLEGLGEMLAQDQGKQVRNRLTLMDQTKSALRTLVIDSKDSFKRETVSFAGAPDVLQMAMYLVAAALGIPVALLFGMEPAGMNATGAFDMRSFYDKVSNQRTAEFETPLEKLLRMSVIMPKESPCKGIEPDQWSVDWRPLWQMSDKEREDTRLVRTQNDVALIDAQIASRDEIRAQRYGGDTFSYELHLIGDAPAPEVDDAHVAELEAQLNARRGFEGEPVEEEGGDLEADPKQDPKQDPNTKGKDNLSLNSEEAA